MKRLRYFVAKFFFFAGYVNIWIGAMLIGIPFDWDQSIREHEPLPEDV